MLDARLFSNAVQAMECDLTYQYVYWIYQIITRAKSKAFHCSTHTFVELHLLGARGPRKLDDHLGALVAYDRRTAIDIIFREKIRYIVYI